MHAPPKPSRRSSRYNGVSHTASGRWNAAAYGKPVGTFDSEVEAALENDLALHNGEDRRTGAARARYIQKRLNFGTPEEIAAARHLPLIVDHATRQDAQWRSDYDRRRWSRRRRQWRRGWRGKRALRTDERARPETGGSASAG